MRRDMARPRRTAAERDREAREEAQRSARLSLRLGFLGVVVLFLSGVGTGLLTAYIFVFLGGMVVGILLILAAFFLVRGSVLTFQPDPGNKLF